jgi:ABC-type antimicrobial peptide transport system permease subunit
LVSLAINFLLRVYTNFQPIVTWPIVVLAVSVSVIIGIIFSVTPAVKAARKDPIDALRGE